MLLVVGQIVRPHGLRGEVIVDVRTDEPEHRYTAGSVLTTDPAAAATADPATATSIDPATTAAPPGTVDPATSAAQG